MTTRDRRAEALERFEKAVELPLLLLAVAIVPLLVVPLLVDVSPGVEQALLAVDWAIWAVFAFEYVVRLGLTRRRWRFVRREWPDLLIIVLPFLRPLRLVRSARALRLLRLTRLVAFLGEFEQGTRRLKRHGLHYALAVGMVVVIGAAALIYAVEEGSEGDIDSFGDALWWAITTITTVGYGDTFPVTPAGRGIAAFLMITGIALFGVLTANVAAFFIEGREEGSDPVTERLNEIAQRLDALEARLEPSVSDTEGRRRSSVDAHQP
jgi:voltage-gated potassium channel